MFANNMQIWSLFFGAHGAQLFTKLCKMELLNNATFTQDRLIIHVFISLLKHFVENFQMHLNI